ncbi:PREDICTED: dual specificity protein phosphatase 21 [Chinchilla lanigera]|uniref:dual specificity protein phosphatase 21 n=1 Tax=Chinchilla lanigera TaxID=34839 RepID=UPI00038ED6ED|nr:PREDICTED: dual specificity protein phosphatase 21 [Chinchilla lanigera]
MTTIPLLLPSQAVGQPTIYELSKITGSLYISNAVTASNQCILSYYNITTVINASVEVENTFFEDIQYVYVPVSDTPTSYIYDFFDPIADRIHSVEMKQGRTLLHCAAGVSRSPALCLAYLMKYHSMTLLEAHTWTKACRPIIRPNNGFWEQLINYEFKLFSNNTIYMVNSPVGMIPNIYENEVNLMMSM